MPELFRRQALEARGALLFGGIAVTTPRGAGWAAGVAVAAAIGVISLLFGTSYARKEAVVGWLSPTSGLVQVIATRQGVIQRVLVADGDAVSADAPLLVIGSPRSTSDTADVDGQLILQLNQDAKDVERQIAHERELAASSQRVVATRIEALSRQLIAVEQQFANAVEQARLSQREWRRFSALSDHVAAVVVDEQRSELLRAQRDVSALTGELERLRSEQDSAEAELKQIPVRLDLRLTELGMSLTAVEREIAEIEHRREHLVRAPAAGFVTALTAHAGLSVAAAQPLLSIVPEGIELQAELLVPTHAVGFVREGQAVRLRYDAFPYQKFGVYPGTVKTVSRSVLSPQQQIGPVQADFPAYRVVVTLESQDVNAYGHPAALQPGLTLRADLMRDRRRIIEWIFDPVIAASGLL